MKSETRDYIGDVESVAAMLRTLLRECEAELAELQQFRTGDRVSRFPLGSKWLMHTGTRLEALQRETEQRLRGLVH